MGGGEGERNISKLARKFRSLIKSTDWQKEWTGQVLITPGQRNSLLGLILRRCCAQHPNETQSSGNLLQVHKLLNWIITKPYVTIFLARNCCVVHTRKISPLLSYGFIKKENPRRSWQMFDYFLIFLKIPPLALQNFHISPVCRSIIFCTWRFAVSWTWYTR